MEKQVANTMKRLVRDLSVITVLLFLTGLFCVLFPGKSGIVICYVIGIALAVWGIFRTVVYFASEMTVPFASYAFVQGIFLMIFGVYCILKPNNLVGMLTALFAVVLIVDGALKLQYSMDLLRIHASLWTIVFVLSLVAIAFGIIVFIKPFAETDATVIFNGILLMIDAAADGATVFILEKTRKGTVVPAVQDAIEPAQNDPLPEQGENS